MGLVIKGLKFLLAMMENKDKKHSFENGYKATFKSADTEEWLDKVWTRPIGYILAVFFRKIHFTPNAVTILSMIIGAASAFFFASGSYRYCGTYGLEMNLIAVVMLAVADFLDSTDGQLARMTNHRTQLGRILDGAASEVWFIPIYIALVIRFYYHHSIEFQWMGIEDSVQNTWIFTVALFLACLFSGFVCHSGQCSLADYYRQIHLLIVNGKAGSELDTSAQQQSIYDSIPWKGNVLRKAFLKTYISYTAKQERWTPRFQDLKAVFKEKFGSQDKVPENIKQEFRRRSLPLMTMANILTFNTRAIFLYAFSLLDMPWAYFVFEIVVMSGLKKYMNYRHEKLCTNIIKEINKIG